MKFSSFILAFILILQSIGLQCNDLLQIGEFIEHAKYHHDRYSDNLFEFVAKHYGNLKEEHHKSHHEESPAHEKLPFQNTIQIVIVAIPVLNDSQMHLTNRFEFSEYKSHIFFYQESFSLAYLDSILQPPKFI